MKNSILCLAALLAVELFAGVGATTNLVNKAVSDAIADKATTNYVNASVSEATADKATTNWVSGVVSQAVSDKATTNWVVGQVDSAVSNKATTNWVDGQIENAVSDKATTNWTSAQIQNAISDKATTNWVNSSVSAAVADRTTQEWVENFVAEYVANNVTNASSVVGSISQVITNGTSTIIGFGTGGTNDYVVMTSEYPDKLALQVTNATSEAVSAGVTNGMLFAWNGAGAFWNAQANKAIYATTSNYTYNAQMSVVTNGVDTFDGLFGVVGTKITKSQSDALLHVTVSFEYRPSWFDRVLSVVSRLFVSTAYADQWQDIEWYSPNTKGDPPNNYTWTVTDSKGNVADLNYVRDSDGNFYCDNLETVVSQLRNSVGSVFENMVGLSDGLMQAYDEIYRIDAQMKEMADNLNKVFAEAWAKMDAIEEKLEQPTDDGGTTEQTVEKKIIEKTKERIVVTGGTAALKVDGKSIGVNGTGDDASYEMKNFHLFGSINGVMPYNASGSISWFNPWLRFDTGTLAVDLNEYNVPDNDGSKHGVHLKGFYDNSKCSAELSNMLSNPDASGDRSKHFLLAKYGSGDNNNAIHWVPIGGTIGGSPTDEKSTTTNAINGAVEDGKSSIYGFASASEGKVPKVKGSGSSKYIEWGDAGAPPDDRSISTNETGYAGKLSIKGWNGTQTRPSDYVYTKLSDDLANTSDKTYYLIGRNNGGSIRYIPVGNFQQIPPRCFQYNTTTHQFENLYYRWGRTTKTATDNWGTRTDGSAYLVIQHSTGSGVLQTSQVSNSDTQTCIPIATISNGAVTLDYTTMPSIPAYE